MDQDKLDRRARPLARAREETLLDFRVLRRFRRPGREGDSIRLAEAAQGPRGRLGVAFVDDELVLGLPLVEPCDDGRVVALRRSQGALQPARCEMQGRSVAAELLDEQSGHERYGRVAAGRRNRDRRRRGRRVAPPVDGLFEAQHDEPRQAHGGSRVAFEHEVERRLGETEQERVAQRAHRRGARRAGEQRHLTHGLAARNLGDRHLDAIRAL